MNKCDSEEEERSKRRFRGSLCFFHQVPCSLVFVHGQCVRCTVHARALILMDRGLSPRDGRP
jgi:hypothetical protein